MPHYLHDDLRPILGETHGVVVFHEQVIEMIALFTGCTLAEADEASRALGDLEGMAETRLWFLPRAMGRGYSRRLVEEIWKVLEAFASFGFCKAHAAAFALPTYQSAWLKTHHPAPFLSGVLTHDPGMYPKRLILDDARRLGIAVLGLDVNTSEKIFVVERCDGSRRSRVRLRDPARALGGEGDLGGRGRPDRRGPALPVPHRLLAPRAGLAAGRRAARARRWLRLRLRHRAWPPTGGGVLRRGRVTRRDLLLQVTDLDRYSRAVDSAARGRGRGLPRPAAAGGGPGHPAATQQQRRPGARRGRAGSGSGRPGSPGPPGRPRRSARSSSPSTWETPPSTARSAGCRRWTPPSGSAPSSRCSAST